LKSRAKKASIVTCSLLHDTYYMLHDPYVLTSEIYPKLNQ
jgi:hypothetical protein